MNPLSEPTNQLSFGQQQLCNELFSYYIKFRQDQLPSLSSTIPEQFVNIQKQIISIVELRKNMEKTLQLDQLQSQHFNTVSNLLEKNFNLERSTTQMTKHIKQLEEKYMTQYIQSLKDFQKESTNEENLIIQKGQQLLFQLSDFKREFNVETNKTFIQGEENDKSYQQLKHQQCIKSVMQSQQRRWDLAKFIYSVKLRQILLRDQLLQERQRVHLDFQRSNSQLIDTLLREKERDKNLRKKDDQKFGEIIKLRDQIDLQNQILNHSEKTLLPILQNQLRKIKCQLKQQQQKHKGQLHKLHKKNQQLIKQMNKAKNESKSIESKFAQKQKQLKDKIHQITTVLESNEEKKKMAEKTLKLNQSKQTEKDSQLQNWKLKFKELQQTNDQLSNKNDQLQSQYNQLILKSSQLNHIKTDLSQKLQKNTKRVQQFQSKLEQAKKALNEKNDQLKNLQNSLNILKSQKVHYQQLISSLQKELLISKQSITHYQSKLSLMEGQLTENFITHNQQRNNLLYKLEEKSKKINILNIELQQMKELKSTLINPIKSQNQLSFTLYQHIKSELVEEMRRSQKIKFNLIDQFVDKVNHFIT